MINGKRHSATRDTARECEQWAATKLLEHKSNNGQTVESDSKPPYSFKQLFDEYWDKVGKHSKSKNWILSQYNTFDRKLGVIAGKSIYEITPQDLTLWRNKRSK